MVFTFSSQLDHVNGLCIKASKEAGMHMCKYMRYRHTSHTCTYAMHALAQHGACHTYATRAGCGCSPVAAPLTSMLAAALHSLNIGHTLWAMAAYFPAANNYKGHDYVGHNYGGHNYIGHNYTGHSHTGHTI